MLQPFPFWVLKEKFKTLKDIQLLPETLIDGVSIQWFKSELLHFFSRAPVT
jgi:hypothetical protein